MPVHAGRLGRAKTQRPEGKTNTCGGSQSVSVSGEEREECDGVMPGSSDPIPSTVWKRWRLDAKPVRQPPGEQKQKTPRPLERQDHRRDHKIQSTDPGPR